MRTLLQRIRGLIYYTLSIIAVMSPILIVIIISILIAPTR